jgi:hypothetical protein
LPLNKLYQPSASGLGIFSLDLGAAAEALPAARITATDKAIGHKFLIVGAALGVVVRFEAVKVFLS